MRLLQQPSLQQKKILLIDKNPKQQNDRTWCFWEKEEGLFQSIVHHQWSSLLFNTPECALDLNIHPYVYKMIRGADFYAYCFQFIKQYSNVHFLQAEVNYIQTNSNGAFVIVNTTTYYANYVFSSIWNDNDKQAYDQNTQQYKLLQHFKGWVIKTEQPVFNVQQAYFMDFRVPQTHDTTFVYVLPTATNKALVEYTFFNEHLLQNSEYDTLLKAYLQQYWQLNNYTIEEEEFGIIPMTNFSFTKYKGHVIYIGTAGGYTKASSGFTFMFIQKNTQQIVEHLLRNEFPVATTSLLSKRFGLYDATLLHVLKHKKMPGWQVFQHMFTKLPAHKVLQFLDNETTVWDELQILSSVPTSVFLPAALKEII